MSHSKPLLQIHELDARYGPVQALCQVSLSIDSGEIVTLIGANGAGKSTLLMSLFGDPQPSGGWIRYQGRDITGLPTHEIAKMGIAQAPEGRRIFAAMSVEENLLMGAIPVGIDHVDADLIKVFELFPRLKERRNQRAGTLSGGEQQMLAIGRALMSRPRLLLLDEPSLGLAPLMVQRIFATIREIRESGATIFLVEQNAHHALKLAQRGYVLVNGEIRLSGTGEELLADPEVRRAYLGGPG
ncbi:MAG TPA: ABC transporter ATP-binding protein [Candidatus Competibacteraceae bacterium]|nr:ABC transporter ATP-binding protein [Candidatus Competibacteraceae bacterium]